TTNSDNDLESTSSRNKTRNKRARSDTSSKRIIPDGMGDEEEDDEAEDDVSKGTADSYMDELKSKNEGTFPWEDVKPRKVRIISDLDDSFTALTEKERQRRQLKKRKTKQQPKKRKPVPKPAKTITEPQPQNMPQTSHFPFSKRSMGSIKPAKRKA